MKRKAYTSLMLLAGILLAFASGIQAQNNMLCQGAYWTEDEANLKMKEFARLWNYRESWEKRADAIREGIIKGMKLRNNFV